METLVIMLVVVGVLCGGVVGSLAKACGRDFRKWAAGGAAGGVCLVLLLAAWMMYALSYH